MSSTAFSEQQRKDRRAADILARSVSLARPAPARAPITASLSVRVPSSNKARPPEVEKLSALDPKDVANALMHTSSRVRDHVLEQLNSSVVNKLNVTRQMVEALGKRDELLPFQSAEAAFASLSAIDLRSSGTALPQWLKDSIVATFVSYFTAGLSIIPSFHAHSILMTLNCRRREVPL